MNYKIDNLYLDSLKFDISINSTDPLSHIYIHNIYLLTEERY